jgi:uncharacterized OsmC-like protein
MRGSTEIDRDILFIGDLSEEQRARLMEIADHCPIHRILASEVQIYTRQIVAGASTSQEIT